MVVAMAAAAAVFSFMFASLYHVLHIQVPG
jgi:hypothetical protein